MARRRTCAQVKLPYQTVKYTTNGRPRPLPDSAVTAGPGPGRGRRGIGDVGSREWRPCRPGIFWSGLRSQSRPESRADPDSDEFCGKGKGLPVPGPGLLSAASRRGSHTDRVRVAHLAGKGLRGGAGGGATPTVNATVTRSDPAPRPFDHHQTFSNFLVKRLVKLGQTFWSNDFFERDRGPLGPRPAASPLRHHSGP